MFGAFVENGPFLIDSDGTFTKNPYSWNTNASLLYFDNPVGVGFSFAVNGSSAGYAHNEYQVAIDLYNALLYFFYEHPQYADLPLWIFGESYAGMYIPHFAYHIAQRGFKVNLAGLGLGSAWVWPKIQAAYYAPYLYYNGRLTEQQYAEANFTYTIYLSLLAMNYHGAAGLLDNEMFSRYADWANISDVYDIRVNGSDPTDGPAAALRVFLNDPTVVEALHTGPAYGGPHSMKWRDCRERPAKQLGAFYDSDRNTAAYRLEYLLNSSSANGRPLRVLLFNGQYDYVCDYIMGTEAYANSLEWAGAKEFREAPMEQWIVEGEEKGWYRSAGQLTTLVLLDAGHMCPFNQPMATWTMLNDFLQGWPSSYGLV